MAERQLRDGEEVLASAFGDLHRVGADGDRYWCAWGLLTATDARTFFVEGRWSGRLRLQEGSPVSRLLDGETELQGWASLCVPRSTAWFVPTSSTST